MWRMRPNSGTPQPVGHTSWSACSQTIFDFQIKKGACQVDLKTWEVTDEGLGMFLNAASPRGSFSIPININLHGARRRQTREHFHSGSMQERDHWGKGDHDQGARTQKQASSIGEDRAILLGFTMMAFSVLMFFVVGITAVKPYINSHWEENSSCVLQQTAILERWVDCRGVSSMPCLTATVYINGSVDEVFLHLDEESVFLSSVCFYIPNCQLSREELHKEVQIVENNLTGHQGSTFPCFSSQKPYLSHAILHRKYTLNRTLFGLLWPCLMLVGGVALVGLVKLTQWLGRLSSRAGREAARCRVLADTEGALYRLLQGSSAQSPS